MAPTYVVEFFQTRVYCRKTNFKIRFCGRSRVVYRVFWPKVVPKRDSIFFVLNRRGHLVLIKKLKNCYVKYGLVAGRIHRLWSL